MEGLGTMPRHIIIVKVDTSKSLLLLNCEATVLKLLHGLDELCVLPQLAPHMPHKQAERVAIKLVRLELSYSVHETIRCHAILLELLASVRSIGRFDRIFCLLHDRLFGKQRHVYNVWVFVLVSLLETLEYFVTLKAACQSLRVRDLPKHLTNIHLSLDLVASFI